MKKKTTCVILTALLISTFLPATAFAGGSGLPDIKLEVPKLEVPDNMPNANDSLREKYDKVLEGLTEKGFGKNSFPDGLGELTPPPGFGSTLDELPNAETLFVEKYGDMWKERPLDRNFAMQNLEGKDQTISKWENSHPEQPKPLKPEGLKSFAKMSDKEFDNYISNLESQYKKMFDAPLAGEAAYNKLKNNIPSFEATNKWADLMMSPDKIASEYAFMTKEQKQQMIDNRTFPEGFEAAKNMKLPEMETAPKGIFGTIKDKAMSVIDSIKNLGKSDAEKKAQDQQKKDAAKYKDAYENYYYQGGFGTSKEQNAQRQEILDVFEKNGIYDRNKDASKARDKEYMGKLIEDNKGLLQTEIPGFKSFK